MAGSPTGSVQECVEGYLFAGRPPRFLLFRRPPERGRIWVPVSGKVEPSDRDLESALRRELAEETGIVDPLRTFPLDWKVGFDGPDGRRWRLHGFGVEVPGGTTPRLSPEHDAFAWLDQGNAVSRLHYPDNREALQRLARVLEEGAGTSSTPNL